MVNKMATSEAVARPNIRIEIQNNLVEEPMQVDENEDTLNLNSEEEEDGEISDGNDQTEPPVTSGQKITFPSSTTSGIRQWPNSEGFETGINVFDKEEQEKLQVRAERFGINPDESQAMNDVQLQELHDSLGISVENEKDVRFEAIHMNGTDEMSTQDVFVYFEIFAPSSIEWINDTSCNVVWNDRISAARALLRLSEPIRGMPVEGSCDPFAEEKEETEGKGRSILLLGKEDKENGNSGRTVNLKTEGRIHVSEITIPVPPGYWRLGKSIDKSILLRFAQRTDRKPFRAERFSQYYKKYGNPNFGGLKGIISESKKKKMKGIFDRHELRMADANDIPLAPPEEDDEEPVVGGNPWGSLAKNWNKDHRQEKTLPLAAAASSAPALLKSSGSSSSGILKRLGHKRAAPAAAEANESDSDDSDSGKAAEPKTKSKVPRMRMYADDEEEKIKRKKALKLLARVHTDLGAEKPDLRSKLNQTDTQRFRATHRTPLLLPVVKLERPQLEDVRRALDVRSRIPRRDAPSYPNQHYRPQPQRIREADAYTDPEEDAEEDTDGNRYQQKSKVTVIIKKRHKPAVASTVWSRIHDGKSIGGGGGGSKTAKGRRTAASEEDEEEQQQRRQQEEDEEEEDNKSSSSSSEMDEELQRNREKLRAAISRPGFGSGLLKSRLGGGKATEHKSPLRIEINNDLFKSTKAAK